MRRRKGVKNFDAPGQRKCRLNGSSIPSMNGGILDKLDSDSQGLSRWITYGEMLKGQRSELVRDASVISPFSVLFGAGSAVEATSNKDDVVGSDDEVGGDATKQKSEEGETEEEENKIKTTVMSIDANLEFRINSDLVEITDTLRGCLHGAVALLVWKSEGRKDDSKGTLSLMQTCILHTH
jgi:hypothetical protein